MKSFIFLLLFIVPAIICKAQFSLEEKAELKLGVIGEFEKIFIMDSIGSNMLSGCVIEKMEKYYTNQAKSPIDSVNLWYSNSMKKCVSDFKSKLLNCYTRWDALPLANHATLKMFEEFVPILKQIDSADRSIFLNEVFRSFKLIYPIGMPFNVSQNSLRRVNRDLQHFAAKNLGLKNIIN